MRIGQIGIPGIKVKGKIDTAGCIMWRLVELYFVVEDGDQNLACAFSFIPRFIIKIKKSIIFFNSFFFFFFLFLVGFCLLLRDTKFALTWLLFPPQFSPFEHPFYARPWFLEAFYEPTFFSLASLGFYVCYLNFF